MQNVKCLIRLNKISGRIVTRPVSFFILYPFFFIYFWIFFFFIFTQSFIDITEIFSICCMNVKFFLSWANQCTMYNCWSHIPLTWTRHIKLKEMLSMVLFTMTFIVQLSRINVLLPVIIFPFFSLFRILFVVISLSLSDIYVYNINI